MLIDNHIKHSLTESVIKIYKILRAFYLAYGDAKFNATIRAKNLASNGQKLVNVQLDMRALKGDVVIVPITSPMDGATKERDYQQLTQLISMAANNPAFQDDLKGIDFLSLLGASSISNKAILEQNVLNAKQTVIQSKAVEIVQMVMQAFMSQNNANKAAQDPNNPGGPQQGGMSVQEVVMAVAQLIPAPLDDYPQLMQQFMQQLQQEEQSEAQQSASQGTPGPQQGSAPQGGSGAGAYQANAIMAQSGQTPQTSTKDYQDARSNARKQMGGK